MLRTNALTIFKFEIDRYGFFGSDADMSANYGLIADNRYFQNF